VFTFTLKTQSLVELSLVLARRSRGRQFESAGIGARVFNRFAFAAHSRRDIPIWQSGSHNQQYAYVIESNSEQWFAERDFPGESAPDKNHLHGLTE
jgi:hypothetical protein